MLKWENTIVEPKHFPDGTLHLSLDDRFFIPALYDDPNYRTITWLYENDAELFSLICLTKAIRQNRDGGDGMALYLKMPYIPHSRMDRVKNREDVFTLKYFAEIINSLKFTNVHVLDPHSHVSEALIENVVVHTPMNYISDVLDIIDDPNIVFFFPDEGAMKRYSTLFQYPYAFGIKNRDWKTGKINGLSVAWAVENVVGKNILIIDDICSRGGTFLHSARKLKELGAENIYLFVSHCENTVLQGELLNGDLIKRIYTTNSIFTAEHPKIEVINIV